MTIGTNRVDLETEGPATEFKIVAGLSLSAICRTLELDMLPNEW